MDERNTNMELEELFRGKLENFELIPGESVRANLMRKVGRKEFLRFNPSRFNIYYLGGIAAAAITAAVLIGSFGADRANSSQVTATKSDTPTGISNAITPQYNEPSGNESMVAGESIKKPPVINDGAFVTRKADPAANEKQAKSAKNENIPAARPYTPEKSGIIMEKISNGNIEDIRLQKKTFAAFDLSVSAGCLPLKVMFSNRSTGSDSCRWIFGDGGMSAETEPQWIFDDPGEYKVTLKVFGPGGAVSSSTKIITVYPRPDARFEIEPQSPIIPDDQIRFVNYSVDAVRYLWEFGDDNRSDAFEPEHKYNRYGRYNVRLIAWSEHGCSDTLLLTDAFAGSGCFITFPNAFIPNSDGPSGGNYSKKSDESAQIFHPVTSGVSEFQLRIFTRTGFLLFESNDINTGWDGYHKGQLCDPGVYIWKVRGTYKNGEQFVKMGDLTLLKQ